MGLWWICSWAHGEIWKISSNVSRPPWKAIKASDIVETCNSSLIIFPMMSPFAKALGTTPKTWLPPKNAANFWIGSGNVLVADVWIGSSTVGCRFLNPQRRNFVVDFWIGSGKVFGCRFLNRQRRSFLLSISESATTV